MIYTNLTVTLSCSAPQREGIQMLNCTCKHYNDSFLSGNLSQKERVKGCVCVCWGGEGYHHHRFPKAQQWLGGVWFGWWSTSPPMPSQAKQAGCQCCKRQSGFIWACRHWYQGWRQQEGADWTLPKSTTAWHLRVWSQSFDEDLSVNHMLAPNLSCP